MSPDPNIDRIFDGIAEAMILVDPSDPASVQELVNRVREIPLMFGPDVPADHPCNRVIEAVNRFESGDTGALAEIEAGFSACKAQVEAATIGVTQRQGAAKPRARKGRAGAAAAPAAPATTPVSEPKPAPSAAMPLAGDEELLRDFSVRAAEHMDDADERLLSLDANPADAEAIDAVFRAFHTIKGMAGFLALDAISEHAHGSESLLAQARKDGTAVSEETIQVLFGCVDTMRSLVATATGAAAPQIAGGEPGSGGDPKSVKPVESEAVAARAGTVRVEEARLDTLLDAIGEMVIAESMVSAAVRNESDVMALQAQVERLDKITRELQQMATSLRMVPLRATFRRMARLVHDVASKAGKQVDFVITGEETELDKEVVDRIADPLVHALRNAVDHGLEAPGDRRAAGKPESGRVELRAFHAGGAIHIEVSDDGQGLDAGAIRAKAIERGLLAADESLDESELFDLVFSPGFSTAQTVTDVSGRGVGMDVVKRTVEELRGRIELRSVAGQGTTLSIRLPITLAIIDGMVARVGDERYIIPMLSIERSVRPTSTEVSTVAGRAEMLSLDDGLLPIVRLHNVFETAGAMADVTEGVVVIVSDNGVRAGLLVCELLGQQQTVIKPLGEGLPEQPGITGGAIMPDGRVGLILDAAGLVRLAHEKGR